MTAKPKLHLTPFILTALVILADQVSKAIVTAKLPEGTIGPVFGNDLLRIVHVRNLGIAFSMGASIPYPVRAILFSVFPLLVMGIIVWYVVRPNALSPFQRWSFAGIVGGGLSNIIDRFLRPAGVVDFIDVRFFGILGMERWPTFNIADASVVVCGLLLILSIIFYREREHTS